MNNVTVSVLMITYNHENFIREAIEGVLMQKTDFPIELIIGEDCSKDSTRKIVSEYAEKYPEIIRPLLPDKNLGMSKNFLKTLKACTGKYIALCEGDDYWTDPYKLQKQVDFLEANEEYSICSHRYKVYYDGTKIYESDMNEKLFSNNQVGYSFDMEAFFSGWYLHTLSVVFRKEAMDLNLLNKLENVFDYMLFYSIMKNGNGYLFNFDGGVYRKHAGGVYTSNSAFSQTVKMYNALSALYKIEKTEILKRTCNYYLFHHIKTYIKYSDKFSINYLNAKTNELFEYKNSNYSYFVFSKMIIKALLYRIIKK